MMEKEGIDLKDTERVIEFYKKLNWYDLLKNVRDINDSINHIKRINNLKLYNISILTTVNSLDEIAAKKNYIRANQLNLPIISVPKGTDKNEIVDAKSTILVDDYSRNLYSWEEAGGIGIKFSEEVSKDFITIKSLKELENSSFITTLEKRLILEKR